MNSATTLSPIAERVEVVRSTLTALSAGEAAIANPGMADTVNRLVTDLDGIIRDIRSLTSPPVEDDPRHTAATFESTLPTDLKDLPPDRVEPTGYAATHSMRAE